MKAMSEPRSVDVVEVQTRLRERPETVILDVRSPGEFGTSSIAGSTNLPVDRLASVSHAVGATTTPIVVVCQSGARATRAATILDDGGATDVTVLRGGMTAWTEAGAPVEHTGPAAWALERQVRLVAGGIVASSIAGSIRFPRLRYIAGAVGLGLVTAAVTDTCAMGALLARLPHNRRSGVDVEAAVRRMRD